MAGRAQDSHEIAPVDTSDAAQVEAEIKLARRTTVGLDEAARIDAMMAVAGQEMITP